MFALLIIIILFSNKGINKEALEERVLLNRDFFVYQYHTKLKPSITEMIRELILENDITNR
jgi:hypothetical protein